MSDLGLPNPFNRTGGLGAAAINDLGQIVGTFAQNGGAFIYTDGQMYDLQTLLPRGTPWQIIYATDINDAGQIVVNAVDAPGDYHGLLLTPVPEPATPGLLLAGSLALIRRR